MTTSGHHDDGSQEDSVSVNNTKNLRNAHVINKS